MNPHRIYESTIHMVSSKYDEMGEFFLKILVQLIEFKFLQVEFIRELRQSNRIFEWTWIGGGKREQLLPIGKGTKYSQRDFQSKQCVFQMAQKFLIRDRYSLSVPLDVFPFLSHDVEFIKLHLMSFLKTSPFLVPLSIVFYPLSIHPFKQRKTENLGGRARNNVYNVSPDAKCQSSTMKNHMCHEVP